MTTDANPGKILRVVLRRGWSCVRPRSALGMRT